MGAAVEWLSKVQFPCGLGTWKKGKPIGRYYAPSFSECEPVVNERFSMKSQTLLYSFEGSQSEAPKPLYHLLKLVEGSPPFRVVVGL
jgi:hypothetical protein